MKGKLIAIGELLIDFTSNNIGSLKNINSFNKNPGGAPANVAVCVSKLGGESTFITKLGFDAFGDYLLDVLVENKVDISNVYRTDRANTPLAFVTLQDNGERDFAFYRNPSSDLYLDKAEIDPKIFAKGDILHFCSVDLVDFPVRYAHMQAIKYAKNADMLISFDPNLRYPLWKNAKDLIETVKKFIPFAHIIKVSEEELVDITGQKDEQKAVKKLFTGNVKIIIITRGRNGVSIYFSDMECKMSKGIEVKAIDATGAGDTFIGTFLYQLLEDGKTPSNLIEDKTNFESYIKFANKAASISVTRFGAIPAMPVNNEVFGEE